MIVVWLFLAVPRGCLQFVIVVFPDHTHLLFFANIFYDEDSNESIVTLMTSYQFDIS